MVEEVEAQAEGLCAELELLADVQQEVEYVLAVLAAGGQDLRLTVFLAQAIYKSCV